MRRAERVHLMSICLLLSAWIIIVMDVLPLLVARLSAALAFAMILTHGAALGSALRLYRRSRQQPSAITSGEILSVFSAWLMSWTVDFSAFERFRH